MRLLVTAVLGIAAVAAGVAAAATAELQRTPLLAQPLPQGAAAIHYVRGGRVGFPPGAPTGRHLHPAPVVGIVTQGSFIFQPQGQAARVLHTGDAFYEPANVPIERFDNASHTRSAEIDAFYLLERADQAPIRMLAK